MQTTSHSMSLKILTATSSVNVKITAMETTLKCRPCARCITGQLRSINIVQVGTFKDRLHDRKKWVRSRQKIGLDPIIFVEEQSSVRGP